MALTSSEEAIATSDWDVSRCRTFEELRPTRGRSVVVDVAARNLEGVEAVVEPPDRSNIRELILIAVQRPSRSLPSDVYRTSITPDVVLLQGRAGNDDPWTINRIANASDFYNLTERASSWMLEDIPVRVWRNDPGHGTLGTFNRDRPFTIHVGYPAGPRTLMHEMMHGFWHHWDGFPRPCEEMNLIHSGAMWPDLYSTSGNTTRPGSQILMRTGVRSTTTSSGRMAPSLVRTAGASWTGRIRRTLESPLPPDGS